MQEKGIYSGEVGGLFVCLFCARLCKSLLSESDLNMGKRLQETSEENCPQAHESYKSSSAHDRT